MESRILKCVVCKSESDLKVCSGCAQVVYCSAEHQKSDWKIHKKICIPFRIANDEKVGRYLQATREIKSGSVIFNEFPLVVGPDWSFRHSNCVGCFSSIGGSISRCSNCQWPCCREECVGLNNSELHGIECLLLKGGSVENLGRNFYRSDVLFPLKCLMLQMKSPRKFADLMSLEKHFEERKSSENFKETETQIDFLEENYLKPLRKVEEKVGKIVLQKSDRKTLQEIFGIIETNAFYLTEDNQVAGLFATACIIEHSCFPNCRFQFDVKNGFKLTVRAATDIRKGEHLMGCYSNILWGTQQRRQHLKEVKYFDCHCQRCEDPTEMNSNFSSLRCIGLDGEACNGIQVPENPTLENVDWVCNKCPARLSGNEVAFLVGKMSEEIEEVTVRISSVSMIESLISKFSNFLHPNHYHMFSLKHLLIKEFGNNNDEKKSEESFGKMLKRCDDLLETMKRIDPFNIRLSIYKADVLHEKFNLLEEIQRRELKNISYNQETSINCLKDAQKVLQFELETVHGQQMNLKLAEALKLK